MANLAALRAAVFFAICEKPYGGLKSTPPPVRGLSTLWDNNLTSSEIFVNIGQKNVKMPFKWRHVTQD